MRDIRRMKVHTKSQMVAIVDDDQSMCQAMASLLMAYGFEVEHFPSAEEFLHSVHFNRTNCLVLDIQMPGRGGFEVIEQTGAARMPITVFVTAHNHHAVRAFEVHALDYLTKPVEAERLRTTLDRVRERLAAQRALITQEQLKSLLATLESGAAPRKEYPARLLIPNGTRDSFINVADIDWIEAADYYSCLHVGTKNLMLRETIKQLTNTLDPSRFVRIHRSVIVNVTRVNEIFREGRGEGAVVLIDGQRLRMSRIGWQSLLAASRKAHS